MRRNSVPESLSFPSSHPQCDFICSQLESGTRSVQFFKIAIRTA
ncbi:unnamed protein product [Rhodiola kirilowii]